jgi:hypothetical protein
MPSLHNTYGTKTLKIYFSLIFYSKFVKKIKILSKSKILSFIENKT